MFHFSASPDLSPNIMAEEAWQEWQEMNEPPASRFPSLAGMSIRSAFPPQNGQGKSPSPLGSGCAADRRLISMAFSSASRQPRRYALVSISSR